MQDEMLSHSHGALIGLIRFNQLSIVGDLPAMHYQRLDILCCDLNLRIFYRSMSTKYADIPTRERGKNNSKNTYVFNRLSISL